MSAPTNSQEAVNDSKNALIQPSKCALDADILLGETCWVMPACQAEF